MIIRLSNNQILNINYYDDKWTIECISDEILEVNKSDVTKILKTMGLKNEK